MARLNSVDELPDKKDELENPSPSIVERPRKPLPQGYRQGIITAITVLLGFTLGFSVFGVLNRRATGRFVPSFLPPRW